MCDCVSYNRPDWCPANGTPEVILPKPAWSSRERGICVDACIAEAIKMLWANGIVTDGCCCGHNRMRPSVVIDSSADGRRALDLLLRNDGRDWVVNQWRLMRLEGDVWQEEPTI